MQAPNIPRGFLCEVSCFPWSRGSPFYRGFVFLLQSKDTCVRLTGDSKLALGVSVSVNVSPVGVCVRPVMDWRPVEGVPHLSPCFSRDTVQSPNDPLHLKGNCFSLNNWYAIQTNKFNICSVHGSYVYHYFSVKWSLSGLCCHKLAENKIKTLLTKETDSVITLGSIYWRILHNVFPLLSSCWHFELLAPSRQYYNAT